MKPSVSSTLVGTYQWDIRLQSQRPLPLHESQHLQEMSLLSGWGSAVMKQREDWPILKAVGKLGKCASGSPGNLFFFFLVLPLYCYQPISLHPHAHMLSHVTPWTAARQAPLSMDFSRQEYSSGLPFPSPPGNLKWSSVHPPALPLLCPSGK